MVTNAMAVDVMAMLMLNIEQVVKLLTDDYVFQIVLKKGNGEGKGIQLR